MTIHIIGAGFGESLVLQMPNGAVGVIDCFSPSLAGQNTTERLQSNPTLRFLHEELRVERLAFVAFTHPHEDHGRGLSHLLVEYRDRIGEAWVYQGFESKSLAEYFINLARDKRKLPLEQALREPAGTFARESFAIRGAIKTGF